MYSACDSIRFFFSRLECTSNYFKCDHNLWLYEDDTPESTRVRMAHIISDKEISHLERVTEPSHIVFKTSIFFIESEGCCSCSLSPSLHSISINCKPSRPTAFLQWLNKVLTLHRFERVTNKHR